MDHREHQVVCYRGYRVAKSPRSSSKHGFQRPIFLISKFREKSKTEHLKISKVMTDLSMIHHITAGRKNFRKCFAHPVKNLTRMDNVFNNVSHSDGGIARAISWRH